MNLSRIPSFSHTPIQHTAALLCNCRGLAIFRMRSKKHLLSLLAMVHWIAAGILLPRRHCTFTAQNTGAFNPGTVSTLTFTNLVSNTSKP
jgi:hypothetical protein